MHGASPLRQAADGRAALVVQLEFARDWEFCRVFLEGILKSYCWCQCTPSLLVQTALASVVSWKTAGPEVSYLPLPAASLLYAGVNSMRTTLPAHCGLIFFHFLPRFRVTERLPAPSRERTSFPCDTVAATGRPDGTAMTWPMLGISAA